MSRNSRHVDEEKLLAYLHGELDDAEIANIEAHLEKCWHCQNQIKTFQEASSLISHTLSSEPQMDYNKIWRNIEAEACPKSPIRNWLATFFHRPLFWAPAVVAATLMLTLLVPGSKDTPELSVATLVESVSATSGNVMILQTAKSGQPVIWILNHSSEENAQ